jgi:hypothetical protein
VSKRLGANWMIVADVMSDIRPKTQIRHLNS